MTRYRLDSQFHCSYLESRGVPGKTREIPGKKKREIISLSFPVHDFRWRHFRWRHIRWYNFRWCNFRWRHIWLCMRTRSLPVALHSTPSNDKSMVLLYYLRDMSKEVCVSVFFNRTKTLYRWSRLVFSFGILLSDWFFFLASDWLIDQKWWFLIGEISWLLIDWRWNTPQSVIINFLSIQKATLNFIQACDSLYR